MKIFLIIIGVLLLFVFLASFNENSKYEDIGDAAKSGLASAGGCLLTIIVFMFLMAQCYGVFKEDIGQKRRIEDAYNLYD